MNVEQIESRLGKARAQLERAEAVLNGANAAARLATPGLLSDGTYDSAVLSGIRRKPNRKLDERTWASYSRAAEAQQARDASAGRVRELEIQLSKAKGERDRVRFERADFENALLVRDQYGWHKVARVNATTVSVETGYSWTDRIPFARVLEIRRQEPSSAGTGE